MLDKCRDYFDLFILWQTCLQTMLAINEIIVGLTADSLFVVRIGGHASYIKGSECR